MISWYMESTLTSAASCLEERFHPVQTFHECVDVVRAAVEMHRGTRRRRHAVAEAGRAGAVVTDPDGDSALVEQLTDIMRMDAVEGEGDRPAAILRRRRADD